MSQPVSCVRSMLKRSRYLHLFEVKDRKIAFNSLTLGTYELSKEEYDILQGLPCDLPTAPCADVREMLQAGLVVKGNESAMLALNRLANLRAQRIQSQRGTFGSMRLSLTERCNMACSYCFQQELFPEHSSEMPTKILDETFNWFLEQGAGSFLTVQYFGGEPLLQWESIVHSHERLENGFQQGIIPGYRETLTTNGTLLSLERAAWLKSKNFDLTFSFDGPPERNDKYRRLRSGRPSYHLAEKGLRNWIRVGGQSAVLLTATPESLSAIPENVRWFVEESGLAPAVVGINAPQPTVSGWEIDGKQFAEVVWETWNYCDTVGVRFHAPGTFIPSYLNSGSPQIDTCVDIGARANPLWPIYVDSSGKRSLCVVHHRDQSVMALKTETEHTAGIRWHNLRHEPSWTTCDECIAILICGGPCGLERLLWSDKLRSDRCHFMQQMTKLVLTRATG